MLVSILSTALFALTTTVAAIPTITAKGTKFFTSDGKQFFVKGVAYQLVPDDPLINNNQCKLDAALMQQLGANSIRVYHVDPAADHTACMKTFADAGIYLWLDLDTFTTQIEPLRPSWNQSQYNAFAGVMDAFHNYDNLAGFFVGNEVLTTGEQSIASPFVKAAARDMKAYRDSKGYRKIPVGYSAADIASLRPNLQNYLACGTNQAEIIDFFALNAYEWCGHNNFQQSGYAELQKNASSYNIPIFFSETGCNTVKPRAFEDQSAIFGPEMSGTWSGSIIYEWIQEQNDYGLISYGPQVAPTIVASNVVDGFTRAGTPTPINPDFNNLSNQWKTLSPTGVAASAYNPSFTPIECPAFTSGVWNVNGGVALPTVGAFLNAAVSSQITAGNTGSTTATTTGTGTTGTTTGAPGNAAQTTTTTSSKGGVAPLGPTEGVITSLAGILLGLAYWL